MKKKFKKILSFGLALVSGISLFGQTKVNAEEVVTYSNANPTFVYTTAKDLGIPEDLGIDFESEGDFTQDSFTLNGFNYAVNEDGSLGTVTAVENPETYESIMLVQSIGDKMFSGNAQYNDIDFSKYTNVKNVVLDMTASSALSYYMSRLPKIENLYVLADQTPPLSFNSSTLKNVILCRSLGYVDGDDWSSNTNFNIAMGYPKGIKFVTIEGFKYMNGKYIESYRNNSNYKGTEDLNCYVIPNEDLPIPAERMTGSNYMQSGGVIFGFTRSRLDMYQRLSAVYIDPAVTKIILDLGYLATSMGENFGDFNKLDTIYVLEGTPNFVYQNLRAENIYLPLPETFLYSDYVNFENVYFYETETIKTLSITDAGVPSEQEIAVTFNVPETTEVTIESANEMIESKVVEYSGEYTPVVEIEIEGKTKTSETKEVIIDEFKAQLLAEIEAEKENKPNDETVNDSETNTDDEEDKSFKDVIEETKEKIKESKPLQIVTATLSVALAGLVAYAIYLLTRKVIRWAKN